MKKSLTTLCLIYKHPKILLGMKKRGWGKKKWNGFGGKAKDGEEIKEAAKREVYEEIGVRVKSLEPAGVLDFVIEGNPDIEMHIFKVTDFEGEPVETEEMKPEWFNVNEIPFSEMWPDDEYWIPLFLEGRKFRGRFVFDKSFNLLDKALEVVDKI